MQQGIGREPKNDTTQKRHEDNATRAPSPVCSKSYRKDRFAPPLSCVLTPLPREAGAQQPSLKRSVSWLQLTPRPIPRSHLSVPPKKFPTCIGRVSSPA